MLEAVGVLAIILQRFRLRTAAARPALELEAQLSLHPSRGLRLALDPL